MQVSKKAESVQKLRAGLPSANADLIDGQIRCKTENSQLYIFNSAPSNQAQNLKFTTLYIELCSRRLEEQINKGHFKLAEERRLVAETDRLRRSRRTLKEWQVPSPEEKMLTTSLINDIVHRCREKSWKA